MTQPSHILVVDDEPSNRELLEALLNGMGHTLDMAADGPEALAKLDGSHDLVLLDVMMPGIDGFEVTRRIRGSASVPDIPICLVTALSSKDDRLRGVEAGANDFIAKPIDQTELKVRTASLLKWKIAQDAIKVFRTELESRNSLLHESYEQLQKLSERKDEFVRIASHDLKNPLMCILGFVSIMEKALPPGNSMTEQMYGMLPRIAHNAKVMQKIIGDFLDFQALEDGQVQFALKPWNLNDLARLGMEQNQGYAAGKSISLGISLFPGLPEFIVDGARISQVVDNLVGNAIKFSPNNSTLDIHTRLSDGHVFFEVIDAGPGLTDQDLQLLFIKYAKLSNEPTGGEKSTGLGLAICKKLIEFQGGEIGGHNNPEGGATFWFKFPAVAAKVLH